MGVAIAIARGTGDVMIRIEGIRVRNYGVLRDVSLGEVGDVVSGAGRRLGDTVVLLGEHGTGKSTLIDVFAFLRDCTRLGVQSACHRGERGGYRRMVTGGDVGKDISIQVRFSALCGLGCEGLHEWVCTEGGCAGCYGREAGRYYEYEVVLGRSGEGEGSTGVVVRIERLVECSREGVIVRVLLDARDGIVTVRASSWHPRWEGELSREQLMIRQVAHRYRGDTWITGYMQYLDKWDSGEFSEGVRGGAGERARAYDEAYPSVLQGAIERASRVDPSIVAAFRRGASENVYFAKGGYADGGVPMYRLSSGMRAVLYYSLYFSGHEVWELALIDNFGDGLTSRATEVLTEALRDRSGGAQVFLATHNLEVAEGVEASDLWVMGLDSSGYSRVMCALDIPFIKGMLESGLSITSLWYSEHLAVGGFELQAGGQKLSDVDEVDDAVSEVLPIDE